MLRVPVGVGRSCWNASMAHEVELGGGFKYFLFSPLFGEDFQLDYVIFLRWVETTNQLKLENQPKDRNQNYW